MRRELLAGLTIVGIVVGCAPARALPNDPALGLTDSPTVSALKPVISSGGASSSDTPGMATGVLPTIIPALVTTPYAIVPIPAPETPSASPMREPTPVAAPPLAPTAVPAQVQIIVIQATPVGGQASSFPNPSGSSGAPTVLPFANPTNPPWPTPHFLPPTNNPTAGLAGPVAPPTTTPTAGPVVPTLTPTPAMPFRIAAIVPTSKCSVTEVIGSVRDGGAPARGYVVRVVSLTDSTFAPRLSRPIGEDGSYEITLARAPLAGRWEVSLLAPNRQQAGATTVIETTGSDCQAGGRQSYTVEYRR